MNVGLSITGLTFALAIGLAFVVWLREISKLTWLRIMCGVLAVIGLILPEQGALILWLGVVIIYKESVPRCFKATASVSN